MLPQGFTSLALTLLLSSGVSGHVPLEGRQDSIREPEIQSSTPTTPPTASPIFPTPLASDTPSKPSSATNGTRFVLQVEYIQDSSRKPTIPEQDRVYLTGREEGAGFFEDGRAEFQFFTLPSWALEFELTKDGNLEFGEPQRTVIADLGRHKLVALTSKVAAPTEAISQ
ncbi:MAG: hypothetical protein M1832_003512 [Thelocarpon impressellum]|nr:MAG: hypothetical protein M1832_003512 [Thelocarpon impressellum]